MKIKRIYNNNVVATSDGPEGGEMIAIGKGLGFGKKPGDELDQAGIDKVFTLQDKGTATKLEKLVKDIPTVYLTIAEEIVEMIKNDSDLEINEDIYITLTDHISMSLEREKNHIVCENPMLMEIKQFYREEFALARKSGEIIHRHMGIWISEEEAGFIALHIVNASMGQRAASTLSSIRMIRDILQIVKDYFNMELDEDSLAYNRFVRHLQFFAKRVLGGEDGQSRDEFLFSLGRSQYPVAFGCADRIGQYVKETFDREVSNAEKGFLIYHIINTIAAK